MAYVNVKDWSVDQVTDWLKGLDNVILQYVSSFLNNGVTGYQLLNLRADDLEHLGVRMLGHQEIILEAVEHLRNFHYELDKENLQTLALKLSCASNSLYKELLLLDDDCDTVHTQVMSDVHNIIMTIKPLAYWLDRSPFAGDKDYVECKTNLLQLGFEMATSAHRGIFSEKPVCTIRKICEKLTKIADHLIQEIMDPMILQPATLDLATLKKKEQELGFFIMPCYQSVHQIAEIKHGSPAHGSKIEEGDEIVQVNYQTVVGWQKKKVMLLLEESPPEIVLTLKKRPRHTKVYGQIYMKPYRLPSRKRNGHNWSTRWNDNVPSPRLLPIINLPPMKLAKSEEEEEEEAEAETELSSSDSEPPDSPLDSKGRMYPLKPRPILQRRNTISGACAPSNKRVYPSIEHYWDLIKPRSNASHAGSCRDMDDSNFDGDAQFLRDKSASCNVGLDRAPPRPTTVIGLSQRNARDAHKTRTKPSILLSKKVGFHEGESPVQVATEDNVQRRGKTVQIMEDKKNSEDVLGEKNEELLVSRERKEAKESDLLVAAREIVGDLKMKEEEERKMNKGSDLLMSKEEKKDSLEPSNLDGMKSLSAASLAGLSNENLCYIDEGKDLTDRSSMTLDYWKREIVDEIIDTIKAKTTSNPPEPPEFPEPRKNPTVQKDPVLSDVKIHSIIKKFDNATAPPGGRVAKKSPEVPPKPETGRIKPAVPPRSATTRLRGKLDKSHSTPAYDLTEEAERTETLKYHSRDVKEVWEIKEIKEVKEIEEVREIKEIKEVKELKEVREIREVKEVRTVKEGRETTVAPPLGELANRLGIPVVENVTNLPVIFKDEVNKVEESSIEIDVLETPPKPPPRLLPSDRPKPAYPSASPKPRATPIPSPRTAFDFPETPRRRDAESSSAIQPTEEENHEGVLEEKLLAPSPGASPAAGWVKDAKVTVSSASCSSIRSKGELENEGGKTGGYCEIQKGSVDSKVSPTNSIVKGLMSGKSKAGKKKSSLLAKRRKVSVGELQPADVQGHLFQRLRGKHNQNVHWERRWFVLTGGCMYGYKTKEDPKAACLIFLTGFTVALASEVKSRPYSFKVYHTGTAFYFSADDPDALQSWIDLIKSGTLYNDRPKNAVETVTGLYSETDESDTEHPEKEKDKDKEKDKEKSGGKKADSLRKFGSLKKFGSKKSGEGATGTPVGSTSLDRKWFFNKSSGNKKDSVPVPTAQFRSYRKIRSTDNQSSTTTGNFTSHVQLFPAGQNLAKTQNASVPDLSMDAVRSELCRELSKRRQNPSDYMHASNPSLCNISDFNAQNSTKSSTKPDSLAGFVTLEELMNRQTEERKMNPHYIAEELSKNLQYVKTDVVYGEVPIRPNNQESENHYVDHPAVRTGKPRRSSSEKGVEKSASSSSCFGKRLGSLRKNHGKNEEDSEGKISTYPKRNDNKSGEGTSNRSLPRTHKIREKCSRYEDVAPQLYDKAYLANKYKERSYELIYCPEKINDVQFATNRTLDYTKRDEMQGKRQKPVPAQRYISPKNPPAEEEDPQPYFSPYKIELKPPGGNQHAQYAQYVPPISKASSSSSASSSSPSSISSISKLKPAGDNQYSQQGRYAQRDAEKLGKFSREEVQKGGKLKQMFGGKSEGRKEKSFLGSPKLHRAIFKRTGSGSSQVSGTDRGIAFESPSYSPEHTPPVIPDHYEINVSPDYPDLEYPPIFEAETYSLADPQPTVHFTTYDKSNNTQ